MIPWNPEAIAQDHLAAAGEAHLTERLALAYCLVVELALKCGVPTPLIGLWTCELDDHWAVALNGGTADAEWCGFTLPRFHCAVTFHGFPAGLFNAFGGQIAAGRVANEETFCEALRMALAR